MGIGSTSVRVASRFGRQWAPSQERSLSIELFWASLSGTETFRR